MLQHVSLIQFSAIDAWPWTRDTNCIPKHIASILSPTPRCHVKNPDLVLSPSIQDSPSRDHSSPMNRGQAGDAYEEGRWWPWPKGKCILICLPATSKPLKVVAMWKHRPTLADFLIFQESRKHRNQDLEKKVYSINIYWRHTMFLALFYVLEIQHWTKQTKILPSWHIFLLEKNNKKK